MKRLIVNDRQSWGHAKALARRLVGLISSAKFAVPTKAHGYTRYGLSPDVPAEAGSTISEGHHRSRETRFSIE
jgi:hypothetical protein